MKEKMEKSEHETQKSSVEVAMKHTKELKDLGEKRSAWTCKLVVLKGCSLFSSDTEGDNENLVFFPVC